MDSNPTVLVQFSITLFLKRTYFKMTQNHNTLRMYRRNGCVDCVSSQKA